METREGKFGLFVGIGGGESFAVHIDDAALLSRLRGKHQDRGKHQESCQEAEPKDHYEAVPRIRLRYHVRIQNQTTLRPSAVRSRAKWIAADVVSKMLFIQKRLFDGGKRLRIVG